VILCDKACPEKIIIFYIVLFGKPFKKVYTTARPYLETLNCGAPAVQIHPQKNCPYQSEGRIKSACGARMKGA
jgi:hypothetical protein